MTGWKGGRDNAVVMVTHLSATDRRTRQKQVVETRDLVLVEHTPDRTVFQVHMAHSPGEA